jgi:hypothetical protein
LIIEGQNAQLIVQHMGLDRMNQTLHKKENRKKADCAILFPGGNGRHLTDAEVIQQKRQLEMEKEQEEAEKESRRAVRESRRAEKKRINEEWKVMLEEHEAAVA